jgi:UDP-glucose 4-epimerase
MTKVLVTGGAGFIGSHIVDAMLERGSEVHVLDDLSSGSLDNLTLSARFHQGDIRDESMPQTLRSIEPDIIIHCAAQISVRASMEDPRLDTEINVLGLINMLQTYEGGPAPYFVFLSTGGAMYGEQEIFPAPETHPVRPESVYGLAKRVSEQYLDLWKRQFSLSSCCLRLANVYGPRQNPHGEAGVVAIFAERLLKADVPTINGTGEQTRDFVYVKDVANAVLAVCDRKAEGIFNVGTGRETSVNEVYRLLARSLESDIQPQYGPGKAGEQLRSCIDATLAKRTFGWVPGISLEEGLSETATWFRERRS